MTAICPDTRVGELLDAYPGLESVLISISPAFEKLKNPLLRRSVAKVATLRQAARIGNVPLGEMLARLRSAAGQSSAPAEVFNPESGDVEPAWVAQGRVVADIDGDAMLDQGVHPLGKVRELAAALRPGEIVRLKTSFRPEPLIEAMRKANRAVYCGEAPAGHYDTQIGCAGPA